MRALIFVSLLFAAAPAAGQTFVDQVDGGAALICSKDSGNWTCEIISVERLRELGYTDVEGTILIEEPEEETDDTNEEEECDC